RVADSNPDGLTKTRFGTKPYAAVSRAARTHRTTGHNQNILTVKACLRHNFASSTIERIGPYVTHDDTTFELHQTNERFLEKTEAAFRGLFDDARARDELQFAFSLAPEFRGAQDDPLGWSTAADTVRAFSQYRQFIEQGESSPLKMR